MSKDKDHLEGTKIVEVFHRILDLPFTTLILEI